MEIAIFVPTYNVETTIAKLLSEFADVQLLLSRKGCELMVLALNDNSSDSTGEILNDAAKEYTWLTVRHNETNLGNAANIIAGYQWGVRGGADIVGCMDGDGEHSPYSLIRHLGMIERGECDSIVGSIIFPDHDANYHDRNMMRLWSGLQSANAGVDGMFYIQSPGYNLHHQSHVKRALELFEEYKKFFIRNSIEQYLSEDMLAQLDVSSRQLLIEKAEAQFPRWGMHGVMIHLIAVGAGAHVKAVYLECFGHSPNRTPDKLMQQSNAANVHGMMLAKFLPNKPAQ